ncbi:MAG: class I SAM-dependent methyltransferase [Roseimicrobium sp.]
MLENEAHWNAKPALRAAYAQFYERIAAWVDGSVPGHVVELGSGLGKIKERLPQCLTTDIFPNPWLDRVEDAYDLGFADQSVSHLILFDVWHHLERSGDALAEFRRVLHPQGRLILFEPAMSLLGRVAYGLCHHEPLGLREPIRWEVSQDSKGLGAPYFAAQSFASRMFWFGEGKDELARAGWRVQHRSVLPALDYVASGGFRGPCFSPPVPQRLLTLANQVLGCLPLVFGTRLLVVLAKN